MNSYQQNNTGDGFPSPVYPVKRLARFLIAVFLVAGFVYLAPNLERLPWGMGDTIVVLRESGIDTGAWYYDDVEECFEGMDFIREKRGMQ